MFFPDTTYSIDGNEVSGTFYEAIKAAKEEGPDTVVTDIADTEVFTVGRDTEKYYLYQYNVPYGNVEGRAAMLAWLKSHSFSQAIDSTGVLSNSKVNCMYAATPLDDVYDKQEKAAGGYYHVRSLSTVITHVAYKKARVSIDLKNIKAEVKSTNAYVILGAQNNVQTVEIGLQLALVGGRYVWKVFGGAKATEEWDWIGEVGSMNCGTTVTLEMILSGSTIYATATFGGKSIKYTANFPSGYDHGFYRMISLCPDPNKHDSNTPNLNCGDYFSGASFKNCQVMQANDTGYKAWKNDDSKLTEFAAAFNEQFIEVQKDTETVSISYRGRDLKDKLDIP